MRENVLLGSFFTAVLSAFLSGFPILFIFSFFIQITPLGVYYPMINLMTLLNAFLKMVGDRYPELLYSTLKQLSELRASDNINLEAEIDGVVGKAVTVMGPRRVLQAIPLNITANGGL